MSGKTLARVLGVFFVLIVACGTLAAQQPLSVHVNPSTVVTPAAPPPPVNATIFTNLGTSTNLYYPGNGWVVSGPTNTTFVGTEQWVAVPFIPTKNSHVTQVQAAIGSLSGTVNFDLNLYQDSGTSGYNSPGTLLGTAAVTHASAFGTCCTVTVTGHYAGTGVSVTAGTVYWIAAETTTAGSTFAGAWAFSVDALTNFNVNLGGYNATGPLDGGPAMLVKGTVP